MRIISRRPPDRQKRRPRPRRVGDHREHAKRGITGHLTGPGRVAGQGATMLALLPTMGYRLAIGGQGVRDDD